jgi:ubiquinone/menaquinone biosynthesis C-methylase UbiE/ribosomal protein S18 acetylase RimI-like enzyme
MALRSYQVLKLSFPAGDRSVWRGIGARPDLTLSVWRPGFANILPYRGAPLRFVVWWLFDRLGLFFNGRYAVAVVRAATGTVVHRTCIFPGSIRTPFIPHDGVEIGDIWTDPAWRRLGIARWVLSDVLARLPSDLTSVFYLTSPENGASLQLAHQLGFVQAGRGYRAEKLGSISITFDALRPNFASVTEVSDEPVSRVQLERMIQRYKWAMTQCKGKVVVDVACGAGPGLGLFGKVAAKVIAGDIDYSLVANCKRHYGDRFMIAQWDAQQLPLAARSVDVVVILEALYYLPDPNRFFRECCRVLRGEGCLLISIPNSELFDFHRSPYSYKYFSGPSLKRSLEQYGFAVDLYGGDSYESAGAFQRLVRPLKALAARYDLIPGSMVGKRVLRRLIFGSLTPLSRELKGDEAHYIAPAPLSGEETVRSFRILYAHARLVRQTTGIGAGP